MSAKHQRWLVPQPDGSFELQDGNFNTLEENVDSEEYLGEYSDELIDKHTHEGGAIFLSGIEIEGDE